MAPISAAAVKSLRERTGLPLMDCKRALEATEGDEEKAVEWLRKAGKKAMEKRADRQTATGRIAVYTDCDAGVGAIVELLCETVPVANNEAFIGLAADLAKQLAVGPGAASAQELLDQPSPSRAGRTLRDHFEEVNNRIRETFRVGRIARIDGPCSGYVHHDGTVGVLLHAEGGDPAVARDICMHIAAMQPTAVSRDEIDPAVLEKEREILAEQARAEGKPENLIEKMIQGRLQNFFAEKCLLDQPFVKGSGSKDTVGKVAQAAGIRIVRFVHWVVGKG